MKPAPPAWAFALGLALASFSVHAQSGAPGPSSQSPSPGARQTPPGEPAGERQSNLAREDHSFLENAIQGSYAEIEGSRLALEKSKSENVRNFARMMVEDHGRMVEEASGLATSKGVKAPTGPSAMQSVEITALKALTGGAFDAMYVNRVGVASHEATVELFEKAGKEAKDPDVKALAAKSLPRLREHLEMARSIDRKQEKR